MIAGIEMSRIAPRLYLGSAPPEGALLASRRFDLVVLCAAEHQPDVARFPGVAVLRVPYDDADDPPTIQERLLITKSAGLIAAAWRRGARVLITCAEGRNRSALVMALVINRLFGLDGVSAVEHLRASRAHTRVLSNPHFEALARQLPGARLLALKRRARELEKKAKVG